MDTSETYIKMCDCPEIQEQSKCQVGYSDLVKLWGHDTIDVDGYKKGNLQVDHHDNLLIHGWWRGKSNHVWLPRQDQIQEMMGSLLDKRVEYQKCCYCYAEKIYRFADSDSCKLPIASTMEQLWLAFYMWEKHKKTWNGDKWMREK